MNGFLALLNCGNKRQRSFRPLGKLPPLLEHLPAAPMVHGHQGLQVPIALGHHGIMVGIVQALVFTLLTAVFTLLI